MVFSECCGERKHICGDCTPPITPRTAASHSGSSTGQVPSRRRRRSGSCLLSFGREKSLLDCLTISEGEYVMLLLKQNIHEESLPSWPTWICNNFVSSWRGEKTCKHERFSGKQPPNVEKLSLAGRVPPFHCQHPCSTNRFMWTTQLIKKNH